MSFHSRTSSSNKLSNCEVLIPHRSIPSKKEPPCLPAPVQQVNQEGTCSSFSQVSRRDVMISNLMNGKCFIEMQASKLSEINKTFSLYRCLSESRAPNDFDKTTARNFVYLDSMKHQSSASQFGHQLFGYGHESPIRVHLSLGGKPEVFNFDTLPLLGGTAFNSLVYSGECRRDQSDKFLDQITRELLELMLKAERNLNKTLNKITEIKTYYSGRVRIHKKLPPPPIPENQHLSKRIFRKLNLLK